MTVSTFNSIYTPTVQSILLILRHRQAESDDRKNELFPGNLHIYCIYPFSPGPWEPLARGLCVSWRLQITGLSLLSNCQPGATAHDQGGDARLLIFSWQTHYHRSWRRIIPTLHTNSHVDIYNKRLAHWSDNPGHTAVVTGVTQVTHVSCVTAVWSSHSVMSPANSTRHWHSQLSTLKWHSSWKSLKCWECSLGQTGILLSYIIISSGG